MSENLTEQVSEDIIKIFYSYDGKDQEIVDKLEEHLSLLKNARKIVTWSHKDLQAGIERDQEIQKQLGAANVILLIVSGHFVSSDHCYKIQMPQAMARNEKKDVRVIPVIARPYDWRQDGVPFSKLDVLPENAKPITSKEWPDSDYPYASVAKEIRKVVEQLIEERVAVRKKEQERLQREKRLKEEQEEKQRNAEQLSQQIESARANSKLDQAFALSGKLYELDKRHGNLHAEIAYSLASQFTSNGQTLKALEYLELVFTIATDEYLLNSARVALDLVEDEQRRQEKAVEQQRLQAEERQRQREAQQRRQQEEAKRKQQADLERMRLETEQRRQQEEAEREQQVELERQQEAERLAIAREAQLEREALERVRIVIVYFIISLATLGAIWLLVNSGFFAAIFGILLQKIVGHGGSFFLFLIISLIPGIGEICLGFGILSLIILVLLSLVLLIFDSSQFLKLLATAKDNEQITPLILGTTGNGTGVFIRHHYLKK